MVSETAGRPALVIVGPTGVGKTALSLWLAERLGGEIVSADSRLFYRGLDIGSAKPTPAEQARIPHHLIDICEPHEILSLAEYQTQVYAALYAIQARGCWPILVGGAGQYVWAVVEGWGIPRVSPRPALRAALERLGGEELHRWLRRLDPPAAQAIHPRNVRRVVRALEVTLVSGRPISQLQRKSPPPFAFTIIGLTCDRPTLYARIDARVEQMAAAGLLAEVAGLAAAGYGRATPAMSGLGYRQVLDYLAGDLSWEEAVARIKFETHRFARQQQTWFRQDDPRIHWFNIQTANYPLDVEEAVRGRLGANQSDK